ncbi:MAG: hypothetical protein ACYTG3_12660 [Planctomycetota bacterium]
MIASLRNIASAQRMFVEAGHGDGAGATFAELTGAEPPLLSPRFRPSEDGSVRSGGYYFRLDRKDGSWCCYAWPVDETDSERRTFHVDGTEEILATRGFAGRLAPLPDAVRDGSWTSAG